MDDRQIHLHSSGINYRRSGFLTLWIAGGLAFLLAACGPTPRDPLRVATLPWPGYESLHLAQTLGYLDGAEVRMVELANTSQIAAAVRNGTVSGAMVTLDSALTLMQEGIELQVVLVMDYSNGADALVARPGIANLRQLRGKRVAAENAAVGGVMLDAALAEAELGVADIVLLPMTVNEQAAAYRHGEVDAVVTFEPVRSELLREGAQLLFDSTHIPNRIVDVLVVRKTDVEHYHSALQRLVAAHFRALDYMQRSPTQAFSMIAPYLGVPAHQVEEQYAGIVIPDLAANHRLLNGEQPRLAIIASDLVDLMLNHKLLYRAPIVAGLANPSFLPQLHADPSQSAAAASAGGMQP